MQWSATYDGAGIRASQTEGNGTRVFHTDGDTLLQETGGAAPDITHTPGFGQRSGSTDRTFHQDWLGSSRYLTDNAGATQSAGAWSAYGRPEGSTGSVNETRLRWGGGWGYQSEPEGATNDTGLVLMGQRYYDPEVMRFISPDPSGFAGGLNVYAYCGGDPVGGVDPTGLEGWFGMSDEALADIQDGNRIIARQIGDGLKSLSVHPTTHAIGGGVLGFAVTGNPIGAMAGAAFCGGYTTYLHTNDGQEALKAAVGYGLMAGGAATVQQEIHARILMQNRGLIPDAHLSSKAPYLAPGQRTLTGTYLNDLGRGERWVAHYDGVGRLIGRTDYTLGNRKAGIPPIHHHQYGWKNGLPYEIPGRSHLPGPYRR